MRRSSLPLALLLQLVLSSAATAQFRTYPRIQPSDLLAEEPTSVRLETLPGGDVEIDLKGGYDVSVQLLQLYLTPDIDDWNWYIPVLLATSPDQDPDNGEPRSLARSLAGEGQGAINLTMAGSQEWRGTRTYEVAGTPTQAKSLTGVWLEGGLQYKGHAATALEAGTSATQLSHTVGAFASLQVQLTVSDKPRIEDLESLQGVAYMRLHGSFAHWIDQASNLTTLLGQAPDSWYGAFQATVGVFLFSGGSLEGSVSRVFGTSIPSGGPLALEDTFVQAGIRFIPSRILGL